MYAICLMIDKLKLNSIPYVVAQVFFSNVFMIFKNDLKKYSRKKDP